MKSKKGLIGLEGFIGLILIVILVFLVIKIFGLNILLKGFLKLFSFISSLISITLARSEDQRAGAVTAPEEMNLAYNTMVNYFKTAPFQNQCLSTKVSFPDDFKKFSIIIERSYLANKDGLFIKLIGPTGDLIRDPEFVPQKYPCVVTGDVQVPTFIKSFIQQTQVLPESLYAKVNVLTISGKNNIQVQYESGTTLTNGQLDDTNPLLLVDKSHICFIPTYTYGILGSDKIGVKRDDIQKAMSIPKNLC